MTLPISKNDLVNAKLDADDIAQFVNGGETEFVVTRTGATYPTATNIVKNVATNVIGALSVSQGVYASSADGLLNTTNGQFFSVVSADALEYVILYLNNAGVADERKRYPSQQAVMNILELISSIANSGTTAYSFQDELGFVMLQFLVDGAIDMFTGKIERSNFNGLELTDDYGMLFAYFGIQNSMVSGLPFAIDPQFTGFEFQDQNGFILAKATEKGSYFGRQTSAIVSVVKPQTQLNAQVKTDIMQVINYGQSLSRGRYSVPCISLTQPFNNVMLKGGVLARATDGTYDASAFVPLIAQDVGGEGETPVNAMVDGVVRRIVEEDGGDPTTWVFAGTSPGRGGRSVAELSPPSMGGIEGTYDAMLKQVSDTAALAKSLGKTYSIWAYHWAQGENDNSSTSSTSRYDYSERMMALFDRMTTDFTTITTQGWRPYTFLSQMNAHRRYKQTNMRIGMAQWTASKCRADIVMTCPNYIAVRAADNNHLTPEGSWLTGEYASRAMKYTMVNKGAKWRPLEPVTVEWTDTHIDITYHVPQGKLVIDDALATTTINSGFDLWVSRSTPLTLITAVTATTANTIRLELSAPAPATAFLSYGLGRAGDVSGPINGARGNVRDTHGDFDKVTSPGGVEYNLHNASIAFEYNRKSGF